MGSVADKQLLIISHFLLYFCWVCLCKTIYKNKTLLKLQITVVISS